MDTQSFIKLRKVIGPLLKTVAWYTICHAGWKIVHGTSYTKQLYSLKLKMSLFWISQGTVSYPAWQILYHVIVLCKGLLNYCSCVVIT